MGNGAPRSRDRSRPAFQDSSGLASYRREPPLLGAANPLDSFCDGFLMRHRCHGRSQMKLRLEFRVLLLESLEPSLQAAPTAPAPSQQTEPEAEEQDGKDPQDGCGQHQFGCG